MKSLSKFLAALAASILFQGCAVSVPAMAEMEHGEKFIGTTTATPLGGKYSLQSLDGKFVSGTYNPWDTSTTRVFNFNISDGRTGRVIVNRTSDTSGYGIGKLSTGEKCKFTYGNTPVFMNF